MQSEREERRKLRRHIRLAGAGALLLGTLLLRLFVPASARTVRAWIFGEDELNEAVSVFCVRAAQGASVPDAVEAFCDALDQD